MIRKLKTIPFFGKEKLCRMQIWHQKLLKFSLKYSKRAQTAKNGGNELYTVGKNRDSWGHFVNIVVEKKKSRVDERGHTSNDLCKLSHFSEIKWMLNQQNCVFFIIARITCLGINLDQILIETIN